MLEKLGPVADKLIRNGMLVEHDLGRLHAAAGRLWNLHDCAPVISGGYNPDQ